jgi:hypothetical protein
MKGSEFAMTFGPRGYAAWEAAALDAARAGGTISWPMKSVSYEQDGHRVSFEVASDYFAVGESSDFLRLPLTPVTAQKIANHLGFSLPTPKMVLETWRAAEVKLEPIPATKMSAGRNLYSSMAQFAEHNALVNQQLAGTSGDALRSGHKKDVVVGNLYKSGKVLIYGWIHANAQAPAKDTAPMMTAPWRIQMYSNIHGESYFDYSHGIRFIGPTVTVDGQRYDTERAFTDAALAKLLSDEGPLKYPEYPGAGTRKPSALATFFTPNSPGYAAYGLHLVRNGHVT